MTSLASKLLIAMPGMDDPRFAHSVVYLCAHGDEGALGLIVNKRVPDLGLDDILGPMGIAPSAHTAALPVRFGGPVEHGRGFVLHSSDYDPPQGTMRVDAGVSMSATTEILERIARGEGPARAMFALGYAGWAPGQLEGEIAENGWLTAEAADDILFDVEDGTKWRRALAQLGIDPLLLSSEAGHA